MASATLSTVVSRILDDLFVDNYTSQANVAILAAIRHYDSYPWWFTEERATTSTVDGQEYYALPDDFGSIDTLKVEINSVTYPLIQRSHEQLEEWQTTAGTYKGPPRDFALYDDQIRLYPVPDDAYTMTISYHIRLPDLSDLDANAWTNFAEELIRRRAEADVAYNTLKDPEQGGIAKAQEQEAFKALRRENIRRVSAGKTRRRR